MKGKDEQELKRDIYKFENILNNMSAVNLKALEIYEQVENNGGTRATQPRYGEPRKLNGQRQIINPGSIGQPRDQNPDSAYGILDTEKGIFEHRRVSYDIADVQKRIRAAGLPDRNAARLDGGW